MSTATTLIQNSISDSTRRAYTATFSKYQSFCHQRGVSIFPMSESSICLFLSSIVHKQLRVHSMQSFVSALSFFSTIHTGQPITSQSHPRIRQLIHGYGRVMGPQHTRVRLPFTLALLARCHSRLDLQSNMHHRMQWALFTCAISAMLRSAECVCSSRTSRAVLPPLRVEHMTLHRMHSNNAVTHYTLHIATSKTDPLSHGHTVTVHRTGTITCPVSAMLCMMADRVSLTTWQSSASLFLHSDSQPVTAAHLTQFIRTLMSSVGEDPKSLQQSFLTPRWGHGHGTRWHCRLGHSIRRQMEIRCIQTLYRYSS
jgi:hypothetical protein